MERDSGVAGLHGPVLLGTSGRAHILGSDCCLVLLGPFTARVDPKKILSHQLHHFPRIWKPPFLSGKQEEQSCSFFFCSQELPLLPPFFTAVCMVQCPTCRNTQGSKNYVLGVSKWGKNGFELNISFINVISDEGILQTATQHIQQVLPCYHKTLFCLQI